MGEVCMKVAQYQWSESLGWKPGPPGHLGESAQLVLLFGSTNLIKARTHLEEISRLYPKALLFGCTTAGEIYGVEVADSSLSVTAVSFEHSFVRETHIPLTDAGMSHAVGRDIARSLDAQGLNHVFLLSPGLGVNGSELVRGVAEGLPAGVTASGGLAGDADRFQESYVLCENAPTPNAVSAIGFYGDRLHVGYGSGTGWNPFGTDRIITKSKGNVLYEFDGRSALTLYKQYLGEHARGLPATALLFPLSVGLGNDAQRVIRTILSVSEADQSMTFAGDIPEGCSARLMHSNVDHLVDGAHAAAIASVGMMEDSPDLAVLVSCVGRKLVMKQRTEEEVEVVREVTGEKTALTGFYSYGEVAPFVGGGLPEFHNQSMTVTAFLEK
jgi:hypothetical protein